VSNKDDKELNDLMREMSDDCIGDDPGCAEQPIDVADDDVGDQKLQGLVQWTTSDKKRFVPASRTAAKLVPAVYEIQHSATIGIYFEQIPIMTQNLIQFPQTNIERVCSEIQTFWDRGDKFDEYGLPHKRGIILWGPPGSGKSCTISLIMRDVVDRGGICVRFGHPHIFIEGMRIMREIEPDTPIVVLMEDIDSTIEMYNESDVLNILDGVNQIDKAVFLATTNYPERLGARIINRPSRFDKRFKIAHPDETSREIYLKHVIGEGNLDKLGIDMNEWVNDTDGFSLAHLKELFVAVVILEDDYDDAIETLSEMREETISSSEDELRKQMGFEADSNRKAQVRKKRRF
jgi:hypothetical protein